MHKGSLTAARVLPLFSPPPHSLLSFPPFSPINPPLARDLKQIDLSHDDHGHVRTGKMTTLPYDITSSSVILHVTHPPPQI